ncbi:Haloacid dehalogenase-like hydrolase [Hypoxylon fuscum]|nr:Haloacid dehalogenase-like hydrolase [Hypoxylon fuscum]
MVWPVFLVCDPIPGFNTWKSLGRADPQDLSDYYTTICRMLDQASSHTALCLLYERLISDPETAIKRIYALWEVPYLETMLQPVYELTTIEGQSFIDLGLPSHSYGLLSNKEKDNIEQLAGHRYMRLWESDITRLHAALSTKTWVGFDLDDTLHEFRRSSGMATDKVLKEISQQYGTPMSALKDEYSRVLKEKTVNAFSDGKTSFDYRRERFSSLLTRFSLPQEPQFMTQLLELYEATLVTSLELKCGALKLLSTLKDMGKKIVVVTEGPQDAQERTVQALGISEYIDFLATTNKFRVTKTDGLFSRVLEHLGIPATDMVYIGDNEQRDIQPALSAGIYSIQLAETQHVSLNTWPPQVNTLNKLWYIFAGHTP